MPIKVKFLIMVVLFAKPIYANDHEGGGHEAPAAEAPAEGHGEGHDDGHGGGGHGGGSASSLPAWVEVESKISALEAKVKAKEGNIEKLLQEKNHADAKDAKMKEIVGELAKEHKEMRQAAEDLEKQRTILRYRFPERGADPKRQYEKIEVKSLKEMEANFGIEGRLQRTFKRAQQQYSDGEPKKPSAHPKKGEEKSEQPNTPHEEGSIILQK